MNTTAPSTNAAVLIREIAAMLADSPAVAAHCVAQFGVAPLVFMDSIGASVDFRNEFSARHGLKTIFPYILAGALQQADDVVGPGSSYTVGILLCIDAGVGSDGHPVNTAMPSLAADGVFEFAGSDRLAGFADVVRSEIRANMCGANLQRVETEFNAAEQYPVQSALMTLEFSHLQTF